jgi:hypothetical protein
MRHRQYWAHKTQNYKDNHETQAILGTQDTEQQSETQAILGTQDTEQQRQS